MTEVYLHGLSPGDGLPGSRDGSPGTGPTPDGHGLRRCRFRSRRPAIKGARGAPPGFRVQGWGFGMQVVGWSFTLVIVSSPVFNQHRFSLHEEL